MFRIPDHQVAGHRASKGTIGPLIDDLGCFYKPLQSDDRGSQEVAFYTKFSSNTEIPNHIRKFFPAYYGTKDIEASDGSGLRPHLVLEDIVSIGTNPSLMDIKMGSRTWFPTASEDYIIKCLKKDRRSTSLPLGFRISGFHIYESDDSGYWKPEKKYVQGFNTDDARIALRKFVSSNSSDDLVPEPDCAFAENVYGGANGVLAQLLKLKAWFEDQTIFHFYSCSILMVYEKEPTLKGDSVCATIKLIDFAHVIEGQGIIDHNFLGGLCSLIKCISEILVNLSHNSAKLCLANSENDYTRKQREIHQ
ncbi:inositol polyphosphate multikinase alpha-like [Humulus lupulus]|uniref:inositol polyphosphate multikinase alpha-like n=1 Tax=Humulus lupulus TaxID=3486 RepID=UPI002B411FFA|nr:inositol polyphosphate multikinase alpha-like [Humulus lupulus]XP_062094858.1 inositol polyphosphate multikinase alpha-like [Humulus lupulus]